MKLRLLLLACVLSLCGVAVAQERPTCGKAFGLQVASCQKLLESKLFAPKARAAAHKACVADAREVKAICLSGSGTCAAQCDADLVENNAFCAANFDPALCEGDPLCEAINTPIYEACLAQAQTVHQACLAACPP